MSTPSKSTGFDLNPAQSEGVPIINITVSAGLGRRGVPIRNAFDYIKDKEGIFLI